MQLAAVKCHLAEAVCYYCLTADPDWSSAAMVSLNPDIEEVPRRNPLPSITCPTCRRTSHHPKDISERYCGNCRMFHADMDGIDHRK